MQLACVNKPTNQPTNVLGLSELLPNSPRPSLLSYGSEVQRPLIQDGGRPACYPLSGLSFPVFHLRLLDLEGILVPGGLFL